MKTRENTNKNDNFKNNVLYSICGFFIGVINGLFGGGGGMLAVPVLEKFVKLEAKTSHATAMCIIYPLCIVSLIVYLLNGNINFEFDFIYILLGVVGGGVIGALLLKKLNSNIIEYTFCLIMIISAFKLIFS